MQKCFSLDIHYMWFSQLLNPIVANCGHMNNRLNHLIRERVRLVPLYMFKPSSDILLTIPRQCFFCGSSLLFMFHVCLYYHAVLSVPCCLVVTYWERVAILALSCVMFPCVLSLPYGVSRQVWYLFVSISNICLLLYFYLHCAKHSRFHISSETTLG